MIGDNLPMERDPAALSGNVKSGFERAAEPQIEDYRVAPIEEGFDWPAILQETTAQSGPVDEKLYLVVFRSQRKETADADLIAALDAAAHEEAMQSEALYHYFAGEIDENRRSLSWCLWTDQQSARDALVGSSHQTTAAHAEEFYGSGGFSIELYDVFHHPDQDTQNQVILERL